MGTMAENQLRLIKKYPNRRLYDTKTSSYITLADVKQMVLKQEEFQVVDAKSGDDLTRQILLQIVRQSRGLGHAAGCEGRIAAGSPVNALPLLATGLVCGGLLLWLIRPSNRSGEGTTFWLLGSLLPSLALTALTVVGGTTLIIGHGGGLYWLAPAVVIAFATGLAGAWVLLVEILR